MIPQIMHLYAQCAGEFVMRNNTVAPFFFFSFDQFPARRERAVPSLLLFFFSAAPPKLFQGEGLILGGWGGGGRQEYKDSNDVLGVFFSAIGDHP